MKLYLHKIRLDSQGYASSGEYFGIGLPLYFANDENYNTTLHLRAADRDTAKEIVRKRYGQETEFFR